MSKKISFMDILAITVVVVSFAYFFTVYFSHNVTADSNFTTQIVTAVIAMDMLILSFYFGNSKNSAGKDATIASMSANMPPTTTINTDQLTTSNADVVNANNVDTVNTQTTNVSKEEMDK